MVARVIAFCVGWFLLTAVQLLTPLDVRSGALQLFNAAPATLLPPPAAVTSVARQVLLPQAPCHVKGTKDAEIVCVGAGDTEQTPPGPAPTDIPGYLQAIIDLAALCEQQAEALLASLWLTVITTVSECIHHKYMYIAWWTLSYHVQQAYTRLLLTEVALLRKVSAIYERVLVVEHYWTMMVWRYACVVIRTVTSFWSRSFIAVRRLTAGISSVGSFLVDVNAMKDFLVILLSLLLLSVIRTYGKVPKLARIAADQVSYFLQELRGQYSDIFLREIVYLPHRLPIDATIAIFEATEEQSLEGDFDFETIEDAFPAPTYLSTPTFSASDTDPSLPPLSPRIHFRSSSCRRPISREALLEAYISQMCVSVVEMEEEERRVKQQQRDLEASRPVEAAAEQLGTGAHEALPETFTQQGGARRVVGVPAEALRSSLTHPEDGVSASVVEALESPLAHPFQDGASALVSKVLESPPANPLDVAGASVTEALNALESTLSGVVDGAGAPLESSLAQSQRGGSASVAAESIEDLIEASEEAGEVIEDKPVPTAVIENSVVEGEVIASVVPVPAADECDYDELCSRLSSLSIEDDEAPEVTVDEQTSPSPISSPPAAAAAATPPTSLIVAAAASLAFSPAAAVPVASAPSPPSPPPTSGFSAPPLASPATLSAHPEEPRASPSAPPQPIFAGHQFSFAFEEASNQTARVLIPGPVTSIFTLPPLASSQPPLFTSSLPSVPSQEPQAMLWEAHIASDSEMDEGDDDDEDCEMEGEYEGEDDDAMGETDSDPDHDMASQHGDELPDVDDPIWDGLYEDDDESEAPAQPQAPIQQQVAAMPDAPPLDEEAFDEYLYQMATDPADRLQPSSEGPVATTSTDPSQQSAGNVSQGIYAHPAVTPGNATEAPVATTSAGPSQQVAMPNLNTPEWAAAFASVAHVTGEEFDPELFANLPERPLSGL